MSHPRLMLPESSLAAAAHEVASRYHSAALLNHCLRSYLWASSFGDMHEIRYDEELLFVSAVLHDIGLVPEFDNHSLPFEDVAGHVVWVLGAAGGWPRESRTRSATIMSRHMQDLPPVDEDAEAHLLWRATSCDISGRDVEDWPLDFRELVLDRFPRLGLEQEFVQCFRDQAIRKPTSAAAEAVGSGIADRMRTNPLERR